jgi:hypothetical protein
MRMIGKGKKIRVKGVNLDLDRRNVFGRSGEGENTPSKVHHAIPMPLHLELEKKKMR